MLQTRLIVGAALVMAACSSNSTSSTDAANSDAGVAPSSGIDAGPSTDTGVDATPTSACVYPSGPYGINVGDVVDPSLHWDGFAPGAATSGTIGIRDLFDCDGSKGINAIVLESAAQWCWPCQIAGVMIPRWYASTGPDAANWQGLGVTSVVLLVQTNTYEPGTLSTATQWRSQFALSNVAYVAADPTASFHPTDVPDNILVDPRTMKIVADLGEFYEPDGGTDNGSSDPDAGAYAQAADPAVAQLATKNKK